MLQNYKPIDKLDPIHQAQHRQIFQFAQGVIEKTFTSVPTTTTLPVGYIGKYISGSTYRIYINIDGVIYYWDLTKV